MMLGLTSRLRWLVCAALSINRCGGCWAEGGGGAGLGSPIKAAAGVAAAVGGDFGCCGPAVVPCSRRRPGRALAGTGLWLSVSERVSGDGVQRLSLSLSLCELSLSCARPVQSRACVYWAVILCLGARVSGVWCGCAAAVANGRNGSHRHLFQKGRKATEGGGLGKGGACGGSG